MRGFRLSHAGLVLEHEGHALFIDPGSFTTEAELAAAIAAVSTGSTGSTGSTIAGVVITHEHGDHWSAAHLAAIRAAAPGAGIFTTRATAEALAAAGIPDAVVVHEGDSAEAGGFSLDFYGHRHEVLHASIPVIDNIGVRVNGALAYGGDSLARPPFRADILGVPIGSPWSTIGDVMDFVLANAPRRAYLTHDGMLSAPGLALFEQRVREALSATGGELIAFPRIDADPGVRREL